ncbi:neurofilament medium polypeptide isoform X5 [Antennarius striatus]|uniref:neurofilament medium polypeptide isoform X5 n=1 Tax=Antennarius striatus TaxID=241820 RepID=UPI0035B2A11C
MGTQGTGRKRSTKKERSTAEDDALNLIAREAEARLAAKRAARAEAREIRMKELERQQKEIFQVQKKYYGLDPRLDDRGDSKWGDIEQWMEDSERYSRSSRIHTLSDEDERMSVGSRGSVRDSSSSLSHRKSKKKKKHKDRDRNGCDDDYSVLSSRSSRLSDDSRASRASRLDLPPASYSSTDLYGFDGLSSSRNTGSAFNGYQPLEFSSYRGSSSRTSSRASSARTSPVDNCSSVASFLRSAAGGAGLPRDLDDVTIPDFSDVEDREYLEKGPRAASALTGGTLTSLGGSSSRRGSGETAITLDGESTLREIKEIHELKDQIQDVEIKYMQNLKEAKDALAEVEEKYRKAMVSNAQLDNEKNNLMYQVDTLKDSLMELEELLSESQRSYEEKVKEVEREKHAHSVLQFHFNEMKETLKQSEELLNEIRQLRIKQEGFVREISDLQETVEWKDKKIGALERQKEYSDAIRIERDELREEVVKLKDILKKHGIVLGPDLNVNGDIGEADVDGSSAPAAASHPAVDPSPVEGNSMLGNTEETLTSREEEEMHPNQFLEAKENLVSSDLLCDVAVTTFETPTEEKTPTKEDEAKETGLRKDSNVDFDECSDAETNVFIVHVPGATSSEENVPEKDAGETRNPDLEALEPSSSVDTQIRENIYDEPEIKQEDVEENKSESIPEEKVTKDLVKESLPEEFIPTLSSTEPQPEPEVENDEAEEVCKSQPQGGAASGKKKRKKRRGKKKGGPAEDKNQEKDETVEEKSKKQNQAKSATTGQTTEPNAGDSVSETLQESKVEEVKSEQVRKQDVEGVDVVRLTDETFEDSRMEPDKEQTLKTENTEETCLTTSGSLSDTEIREDDVLGEQDEEQSLGSQNVKTDTPTDNCSPTDSLKEHKGMDPENNEQNEEQTQNAGEEKIVTPETLTTAEPQKETKEDDVLEEQEEPSLATETTNTDTPTKTPVESRMMQDEEQTEDTEVQALKEIGDDVGDEENKEQNLETEEVEAGETPGTLKESRMEPKNNENVIEQSSETENDDEKSMTPSDILSNDEPLKEIREDENLDDQKEEQSSASETVKPETPTEILSTLETLKDPENVEKLDEQTLETEKESMSPSTVGDLKALCVSALSSKLSKVSDEAEEAPEMVQEDEKAGAEIEQQSVEDKSQLEPDGTEKEELKEEEGDGKAFNAEKSLDEQLEEPTSEESADTKEIDTFNSSDPLEHAAGIGCSTEEDDRKEEAAEDPDLDTRRRDLLSETHDGSSEEQPQEPDEEKSEDAASPQPNLRDTDEEDGDDEEGQSFDFDDMDVEVAIATNLPEHQQDSVEEGVEVTSEEGGRDGSGSGLTHTEQSPADEDEQVERKPLQEAAGGNQKPTAEEEEQVAVVEESGVVSETVTQTPVEEGLDAVAQLQEKDEASPQSVGPGVGSKETKKDVKKNSKKGKAKGKEECKMS